MRDTKLIVIVLLLFLLLVSIGGVYYFYDKNLSILKKQEEVVSVFVAKKKILPNTKITKKDLKAVKLQKVTVPFKVLIENEIVGKYATVPILKDEPIRPEKISKLVKKEDTNSTAKKAKHDLYNISSKLFKNPNFMLKTGDLIDIVGVWHEDEKLIVKYIANSAEVYGFLFRGVLEENALKKVEKIIKDKKTKKETKKTSYQYADELLIDTEEEIITAIIEAHNKGDQLWMVMSGAEDKEKVIEDIKKSIQKPKKVVKKKRYISYPKATITYGTDKPTISNWNR